MSKIFNKLLSLHPLSNKKGLDIDTIDDDKFKFNFSWIFNTKLFSSNWSTAVNIIARTRLRSKVFSLEKTSV